jgi:pimeloyl-ACP methyl ester carboxylesterase
MASAPETTRFLAALVEHVDVGSASVAYRRFGAGPPLVLLHGWPFSGVTFRYVVPRLASQFTCYVLDLPGAGESRWSDATDFSFDGRAAMVKTFAERVGLSRYSLIGHDTGGTVARRLAASAPERIDRLAAIDTEIPGHRPPWIPLYRVLMSLPASNLLFRQIAQWRWFVHSTLGFGACYQDRSLLDGEFKTLFIDPIVASSLRMDGQARALRGIDWSVVDDLASTHARITAPTLLVWGEEDTIFPLERARPIAAQFPRPATLRTVPDAKFLVHEERPDAVADALIDFLTASAQ